VDLSFSEGCILVCARIVDGEERFATSEHGDGGRTHGDCTTLAVHQVIDSKDSAKALRVCGSRKASSVCHL
jgi:hypothetical protein